MTSRKLTSRALRQRYGVVDRTIDRWVAAGVLPEPMRINGYRYWDEADIELRDRERMLRQPGRHATQGDGVMHSTIDFKGIAAAALTCARTLLPELIPGGQFKGDEYIALNPSRADKNLGSFKI